MTNLSQLTTEQFEALRKQAYEAGTKGELPPEELLAAAPHTPHIDPLLLLGNQRPSETPGYSDHYTSGPKLGETNYFPSSISEKESDIIELYRQRPNIIENRERPTRPVLPNWEALVDFENPVFRQAEAQSTDRVRLLDLWNHFATGLMDLLSETSE